MLYRPKLDTTLNIGGSSFSYLEHPNAKGMVYGQAGKRGTVYKIQDQTHKPFAFKVFTQKYRSEDIEVSSRLLAPYQTLPGLEVCGRLVLSNQDHSALVEQYPDLEYAVLMPWIEGETWFDMLKGHPTFSLDESRFLASTFVAMMANISQRGLAHCDISGPNLLINFPKKRMALVDVEEMYGPGFTRPSILPSGTAGYGHKTAGNGLWSPDADRFASSVLIAEILGKSDDRFGTKISDGAESFFEKEEIHTNSSRYQFLSHILLQNFGQNAQSLFEQAWFSDTLDACPRFEEWSQALTTTKSTVSETVTFTTQNTTPTAGSRLYGPQSGQSFVPPPAAVQGLANPTAGHSAIQPPPIQPGGPVSAWRSLKPIGTPEGGGVTPVAVTPKMPPVDPKPVVEGSTSSTIPISGGMSPTTRIFWGFAFAGTVTVAVLVLFGSSVEKLISITRNMGFVFYYGIGCIGIALILGLLQAWVFKDRLHATKRLLYILITGLGGLVGGIVMGVIATILQTNGSPYMMNFLAGAIIGGVGGGISSLGQNIFLGNSSASRKWFLFNLISWTIIWSIGWWATPLLSGAFGTAVGAGAVLILSGVALQYLLKTSPEIEF